jgi:hypothetical protein
MAKHGESERDVLSKEEMKSTKGGAGAGAMASAEAALKTRETLDQSLVDPGIQAEAVNAIPIGQPVVGVNAPPPPPTLGKK